MKLFLENVRSFEGWHDIPIAPATVLLGENSAGKSTLLGMLAIVLHKGFPFDGNLFNRNHFPFEFGGYKSLASNKSSQNYFSIGFQFDLKKDHNFRQPRDFENFGMILAFREKEGLPVPCHVFTWLDDAAIVIHETQFKALDRREQLSLSNKMEIKSFELTDSSTEDFHVRIWRLFSEGDLNKQSKKLDDGDKFAFLIEILVFGEFMRLGTPTALAFAPMRSRPKRTYDQLSDAFSPEGDHVPLLLARANDPSKKDSKSIHGALRAFGTYSGMFSDVDVKQLGRGSGNPFQVQVSMGRKKINLMDVGYGVSQILPLIVDAQRAQRRTMLLLQQPEVHLHPKAQAALGSMIKDWVSKDQKWVVVETHSDHLVDRLRLEVKRKNMPETDLLIYFLDKNGSKTMLHPLKIDSLGNVMQAPEGYRDFFLQEQSELLLG
jgi:energy-coupling factor transporter ATP-binding protein EcfA2